MLGSTSFSCRRTAVSPRVLWFPPPIKLTAMTWPKMLEVALNPNQSNPIEGDYLVQYMECHRPLKERKIWGLSCDTTWISLKLAPFFPFGPQWQMWLEHPGNKTDCHDMTLNVESGVNHRDIVIVATPRNWGKLKKFKAGNPVLVDRFCTYSNLTCIFKGPSYFQSLKQIG